MKKFIVKILIFSILAGVVLISFDSFFLRNQYGDQASFNSFYNAKPNTVDILLLGNSHLHRGIDPYIIEAKNRVNTEILVGGGSTISQVYFNLLEALEYQSPKVVVIETWPLIVPNYQNNELFDYEGKVLVNRNGTEYFKRFGKIKIKEIVLTHPEKTWYHLLNVIRFHDFWKELEVFKNSFIAKIDNSPKKIFHNSIVYRNTFITNDQISEFVNKKFEVNDMFVSEPEMSYINKIIELSKINNFELLFITVPVYDKYYEKVKLGFNNVNSQILEIIENHKNVRYFDINGLYGGLDFSHIVKERTINTNQHLNYKGGIKVSNSLANFININYVDIFTDVRETKKSFEYQLYNKNEIKNSYNFDGQVTKVDNNLTNGSITIEGWMFKKGLNNWKIKKGVALKKNNDFIFITSNQLKNIELQDLVKNKGNSYKPSGYRIRLSKFTLDQGDYEIHHLIESEKGDIFTQYSNKKISIN